MKRRHFLGLTGAFATSCREQEAADVFWKGLLFGIEVSIRFRGVESSQAQSLGAMSHALMRELESAFSLWDEGSELRRLNRDGGLRDPSTHLIAALEKADHLYQASGGLFDPSIHSYLTWVEGEYAVGRVPDQQEAKRRREWVGFSKVRYLPDFIELPKNVSLSLNAIAQGYATDVVTGFLRDKKVESALVNFGEFRVVGHRSFLVEVKDRTLEISRALAVSSGSGRRLSATRAANHLIEPETGNSPPPGRTVAVEADEAWLADGLATIAALGGAIPAEFSNVTVHRW